MPTLHRKIHSHWIKSKTAQQFYPHCWIFFFIGNFRSKMSCKCIFKLIFCKHFCWQTVVWFARCTSMPRLFNGLYMHSYQLNYHFHLYLNAYFMMEKVKMLPNCIWQYGWQFRGLGCVHAMSWLPQLCDF